MITQRANKRKLAAGIFCAFLIVLFLTIYIWQQAESVSVGYSAREFEEKIKLLRKEIEELEAKKASLLALERVEQIAREQLMMVTPHEDQIIYDENH